MRLEEDVIEPELTICDPHHHLYDWPESLAGLPARYMLGDFLDEIKAGGHKIESTVFVECTAFYRGGVPEVLSTVGETEFANGVAAMAASGRYGPIRVCEGIVGRIPLGRGGKTAEAFEAHSRAAGARLKGIRDCGSWDDSPDVPPAHTAPPKGLYESRAFREDFKLLERFGLSFDALQYHPQLPEVIALADAFPKTQIMLNHLGVLLGLGPYAGKEDAVFKDWSRNIHEIAKRPNVWVKLGGLGVPIGPFDFHQRPEKPTSQQLAEAWGPYIETCIAAFGPTRAMFESNFPVDGLSCTYRAVWNAFKRIAKGASAGEKAMLFRDSARRFYRLS